MITPLQLLRRARALLLGQRLDREMDEEIAFHLEQETRERQRLGASPERARREARLAFGAMERVREEGRDARGVRPLHDLGGDVRYALRILARAPVFTLVAVTTLALGIGANTAIFSVVYSVLLRPLPYPDTPSLVSVWSGGHSRAEFAGVRYDSRTLVAVAAYMPGVGVSLSGDGDPIRITGAQVTADFFGVLQVQPALGRFFREGDDLPGSGAPAVISHSLWRDRFGSDPSIIGRAIDVDGESRIVIGVARAGFGYPSSETRLWTPLLLDARQVGDYWGSYGHQIIGRLRPGVSTAQARDDVLRIATQLQRDNPVWRPALPDYLQGIEVAGLQEQMVRGSQHLLYILLGAVGLVLLMACANVANLLVVRGAARDRELSIRTALGAGSRRLTRQLLVEHLVLSAIGGAVGVLLAVVGVKVLVALLPASTPRLADVTVDAPALAFALLVTVATGLFFGIGPARRVARVAPASALAGARVSQGGTQRRLASGLVSLQIAIGVILAVGAGLLVRSFARLLDIDPGFAAEQVVAAQVNAPRARYATADQQRAIATQALERLTRQSGIAAAAVTSQLPFDQTTRSIAMSVEGWTVDPNKLDVFEIRKVSPDFFRTMGIPLRRGRGFDATDGPTAPRVAIVSESAMRRFWSGREVLGGQMRFPWPSSLSVVGVVADIRNNDLTDDPAPALYVPFAQDPEVPFAVVAQGTGPAASVSQAVRAVMADVAPDAPLSGERTLDAMVSASLASPRAATVMLVSFGALALLLGSVGTYGLVAYGVESRRREFAVRIAIGARRASVMRLVLGEGARLTAVGIMVGLAGALALSRGMRGLLFEIAPTDPVTLLVAPLLLAITALAACAIPAWRATRIDPNSSLRRE